MKRYYFDIRDGEELVIDKEGVELPAIGNERRGAPGSCWILLDEVADE